MRGEERSEAFVEFSGLYGDRYFAFKCTVKPWGFSYLTASHNSRLLQFHPRFRYPAKAARPTNLAECDKTDREQEQKSPAAPYYYGGPIESG
jgi:hypothetical protein